MSVMAKAAAMLSPRAATHQIGPIGLDLGLQAVHLVQLESFSDRAPQVRARASLPIDGARSELLKSPNEFRSLIKKALEADRFHGRQAVLAMPSGSFRTVSINYPKPISDKHESAAILRVMQDRLDGDLSDYVLDYMPVKNRSKNDERLALVAVCEREPIINYLELARKAGLQVTALEVGPVAISRLVGAMSVNPESRNILVINSGRRASYLTLISGDDLLFDQEVSIGENSFIEQICEALDMPENMARDLVTRTGVHPDSTGEPTSEDVDENGLFDTLSEILKPEFLKLVEEIKRAFLYAASETRGGAVAEVYLLGSIARWPGSDKLLTRLTGVHVAKVPDPLALFPTGDQDEAATGRHSAPEIAVATGLALRGMQSHG